MKIHSLNLHRAGPAFHSNHVVPLHGFHILQHGNYAVLHTIHRMHPLHRVYTVAHAIHMMHPLHRVYAVMVGIYMQHAGHWASDFAPLLALLLTCIFGYLLYILLTSIQVIDYTHGVWALFG